MVLCQSVGSPVPENQQAPVTFSGATTNVCRDQSRVFGSAGFGGEEGAHVENIDAVKLTERLEALETSCFFDISKDVTGFRAGMVAAFHVTVTDWAASENVSGEVVSVRMASVLTVRIRKGALAILLLKACISVCFEDLCYQGRKVLRGWENIIVFTSRLLSAIVIPLIFTNQNQCYVVSHQVSLDHPLMPPFTTAILCEAPSRNKDQQRDW